jgi:alpha-1,2-mannosyltransferase
MEVVGKAASLTGVKARGIENKLRRIGVFVICTSVLFGGLLSLVAVALLRAQKLPKGLVASSQSSLTLYLLRFHQGRDSWDPIMSALGAVAAHKPVYQTVFFDQKVKFQYPLTSLLPFYFLNSHHLSDRAMFALMNGISWIGVWATIAGSFLVLQQCLRARGFELSRKQQRLLIGVTLLAGLTFYPLVKGYSLGQIQTVIDALFAFALYAWLRGKQGTAGALFGVMSLIKPQYAVILVWMALRRRWNALVASLAVSGLGVAIATVVFGLRDQLDYLRVLSFISSRGETYFANQSVNGVLHRLMFHGNDMVFPEHSFAPYSQFVYGATLVTSVLLLIAALVGGRKLNDRGSAMDLVRISLVATMASPVVWEHHYGIALAIFAYLAGTELAERRAVPLGAAFLLMSCSWNVMNVFAQTPVMNMLLSLCFFGALILLRITFLPSRQEKAWGESSPLDGQSSRELSWTQSEQQLVAAAPARKLVLHRSPQTYSASYKVRFDNF